MGALADVQAQQLSFNADGNSPLALFLKSEIARLSGTDFVVAAAFTAADSLHTLSQDTVDHTGGDFTLTIALRTGEIFTTAAIAFNATAGTIETAIDTAASGVIPGWTNGDISVAGGILQAAGADVTLTYDGTSVAGREIVLVVFTDSMTGGTSPTPREVQTTVGQSARPAWALLNGYGVIDTPVPDQSADASTTSVTVGVNLKVMPDNIVKALMREAAAEDKNNGSYFSIQGALYTQDRSPLVEQARTSDDLSGLT